MDTGERERNSENLSKELREQIKKFEKEFSSQEAKITCKISADCPPGYVCMYGQCIKIAT